MLGYVYDAAASTLYVGFPGGVWAYPDCPSEIVDGLNTAESYGKYFIQHVRKPWEGRAKRLTREQIVELFGEEPYIDLPTTSEVTA